MKKMKAFFHSIQSQLAIYAIALGSFGVVAFLARFPAEFFWYSVLVFTFFVVVFLLVQGMKYQKRYEIVADLNTEHIPAVEDIPSGQDPIEQLYQEKLVETAEDRYRQSQRYREDQGEQLEYFTLWLHQIKTPLAAMSLLNQSADESAHKRQMEQELIRVEDYTHMALNYLKLTEQSQELELEAIDVDSVIRKVIKKYAILFIYNQIQLDYQPTGIKVVTDAKWLEVLIEQVLSNSLKYTPKGKVRIYAEDQTLVIADNGIGIRADDLPKIFEKGYSGMNGRLQEKSTGLGLFLARKICARLGHTIRIESELNQYTKVTLDLSRENLALFD